jgi:predicted protein tyrosine phosphatase
MSEDGDNARHHICGIDELGVAPLAAAKRIVSILNPGTPVPPELEHTRAEVLFLRFNDVIVPNEDFLAPSAADIEALLAFDRGHTHEDRLVVHCTAGISRSSAALAILLAKRRPGDEAEIFREIREIRPQAWPNSLMIRLADDLLGREGAFVRELYEHYKVQLGRYPKIAPAMIALDRMVEIPMGRIP